MNRARRIDKLEPVMHERWHNHWEAFMDRTLERVPQGAIDLLASEFTPPSADEDAEMTAYEKSLFCELGLEPGAWVTWYEKAEAVQPQYSKGKGPLYASTPERIPQPPCNPSEALAAVHAWTYPHTREGLSRAAIALLLAQALEVARGETVDSLREKGTAWRDN